MVDTVEMNAEPYSHSMAATAPETKRANETSHKSDCCCSCCCGLIIIGIIALSIHLWLVYGYGKFLITHTHAYIYIGFETLRKYDNAQFLFCIRRMSNQLSTCLRKRGKML